MKEVPLVMCLTNTVAANFTANCLLAVGAKPAMVEAPSEAEELARTADALLVNLGTLTALQAEAIDRAVTVANTRGIPWVLDPVGVQLLSFRRRLAEALVTRRPALIRCNAAESAALGATGIPTLETGEVDQIFDRDGTLVKTVTGGVAMLSAVTATGCAQGGLAAAQLAHGLSPLEAAATTSRLMKSAGEEAARHADAPGGFQLALIDALWRLSHD